MKPAATYSRRQRFVPSDQAAIFGINNPWYRYTSVDQVFDIRKTTYLD